MKNKVTNQRKSMSLKQVLCALHTEAKNAELEREDEVNADFSSEVEFLLGLKGRWLLCHMGKNYPYTIRLRLIGEDKYEKVKPGDFINIAKQKLLH